MSRYRMIFPVLVSILLVGCMDSLFEQASKKSKNSIIGKTTQEIEKFDPNANIEISDSDVEMTNPITGALEAYGPALEKHFKGQVNYAIELFRAEKGRYPNDYEEFMEVVVKQGQIKLPVLPGDWKYSYDEEAHDIKVIRHLDEEVVKQEAEQKEKEEKAANIKQNPAANFLPGLRGVQGVK